jgi:hypothetical protein
MEPADTTVDITREAGAGSMSHASSGSAFVRDAINKRLEELRGVCALKRELVRQAFGRGWSGAKPQDPPSDWDKYWADLQSAAQRDRPKDVEAADKALADFIAEHRPIMGADWPGTSHGRLCWAGFLGCIGGRAINHHYCQRDEGHDGPHEDAEGQWPNAPLTRGGTPSRPAAGSTSGGAA